jgi:hypothetical protein
LSLWFSERLTQAEERENGHNYYDQSDEVYETIHVFLVFSRGGTNTYFAPGILIVRLGPVFPSLPPEAISTAAPIKITSMAPTKTPSTPALPLLSAIAHSRPLIDNKTQELLLSSLS